MRNKAAAVVPYCLLLFFLVTGIITHRDYGMSWDEDFQYTKNGHAVWDYITGGDRADYENNPERYHGPAFELVLVAIEKISGAGGTRQVFFQRHLVTFLLFWLSGVALFFLLRKNVQSGIVLAIGITWYFLMPRIYADAFYNSKDIPVLAFTMISLFSLHLLIEKKHSYLALIHGGFCGFLVAIRLAGIVIPAITVLVLLYATIISKFTLKETLQKGGLFLLSFIAVMFACWPILWEAPLQHLVAAWKEMSSFPFNKEVLFKGEFIPATRLPWDYIITWIGITTPLLYLFFICTGIYFTIRQSITACVNKEIPHGSIYLVLVFLPLLAICIFNAVVYDGWRHMYYLYAPICLLMVTGLAGLLSSLKTLQSRYLLVLSVIVCTLSTGRWMIQWHPYQQVYFNQLAGTDIRSKYEMDYWGLSYREALEKIAAKSDQPVVNIVVENTPGHLNFNILADSVRQRLNLVDSRDSADFYITNYRWNMQGEPPYILYDSIVVDGERISGTYVLYE